MKGSPESEKTVERHLVKQMKSIGGEASKWECPSRIGKPDRVCEFPKGLVVFAELKTEGRKPSGPQQREHKRMRDRGQTVVVLDSRKAVDQFITTYQEIDNEINVQERIKECGASTGRERQEKRTCEGR